MAHVIEDIVASSWSPGPGLAAPPGGPQTQTSSRPAWARIGLGALDERHRIGAVVDRRARLVGAQDRAEVAGGRRGAASSPHAPVPGSAACR